MQITQDTDSNKLPNSRAAPSMFEERQCPPTSFRLHDSILLNHAHDNIGHMIKVFSDKAVLSLAFSRFVLTTLFGRILRSCLIAIGEQGLQVATPVAKTKP